MAIIRPYQFVVPDSEIEKLQRKLEFATFPDELDEAGWDYGAPLNDVKRLVTYWKDQYRWRDAEAKINELPNYETTINVEGFDPLQIHFVHQRSSVKAAIPLLFVHGCTFFSPSAAQTQ